MASSAQRRSLELRYRNSDFVNAYIKWMARANTWAFKATGGRVGAKWRFGKRRFRNAPPVGILTTTGRKTGVKRDTPLLYLREGDRIVLVASSAGRDRHPMWYRNLLADPNITFQIKSTALPLVAREASEAEREQYWPRLDALYPDWTDYRTYTDRRFPILICDPPRRD